MIGNARSVGLNYQLETSLLEVKRSLIYVRDALHTQRQNIDVMPKPLGVKDASLELQEILRNCVRFTVVG